MNKLVLFFLQKTRAIKFLELFFPTKINNTVFSIPVIGGLGTDHLYENEPWKDRIFLKEKFSDNACFIDIGVNIGHTLVKLKSIYPNSMYYGFEPNPTCVYYLSKLTEKNKLKTTTIIPAAFGNENSLMELYFNYGSADEGATLVKDFRNDPVTSRKLVPIINGAEFIGKQNFKKIDFIKIDVEGYEFEVLNNLSDVVKKYSSLIMCEILPVYNKENTFRLESQKKIMSLLKEWDYSIFRIHHQGYFEELKEIEIHSNIDWAYYLFVPRMNSEKYRTLKF